MRYTLPSIVYEARLGSRPTKPRLESVPGKPIRVIAVDDHFAVRAALVDTIQTQPDMVLAGVAASADEALQLVQQEKPDVAVVDINLGEVSGIDLIERLREIHPSLKVVIFSIFDEAAYGQRAMAAGALGYVAKSESTQRVVEAIRVVAAGVPFFRRRPVPTRERTGNKDSLSGGYGIDDRSSDGMNDS